MFFQAVDLTTALRPSLLPDETLLFVQDAVGLYEGKYKIPNYQCGHAYLTSHRICYVDLEEPRKCILPRRRGTQTSAPASIVKSEARTATWVCPICSFSNPVPSNFDPAVAASTAIPPCLACGIKPPLTTLLKAAISASTSSSASTPTSTPTPTGNICPRYSPAPFAPSTSRLESREINDCVKLSFRAGGERVFHERLKGALVQRKWILQDAPPVPTTADAATATGNTGTAGTAGTAGTTGGIAGLERRGLETRRNNEAVIGGAFEDLEALMASAREVVALAETFSRESSVTEEVSQSAAALGMMTTKEVMGSSSSSSTSASLYVTELSRNLAEYLTDERQTILAQAGGIMSLIDLWAAFNRARNGVELVSPRDFHAAAEQWERLRLPVRLRRFKSGLLVVQRADWTDEQTLRQLREWFDEMHRLPPAPTSTSTSAEVTWDWRLHGRGVTAQETGRRFGWSVGVAGEELEMAEERGLLCREQGIEGLRFWGSHLYHRLHLPPSSLYHLHLPSTIYHLHLPSTIYHLPSTIFIYHLPSSSTIYHLYLLLLYPFQPR
ncbi:vacuolar protein-sorting-associated protein 36 [Microsporum canis CBS 113480]|uniref:Vacuolar protein-sorting-associated protein 36 n=1 Tax=Arthroderma otae (strain ATCC MYA-4605 / CBS 113480) TaxID=554155 RepID=C5FG52_ARTOC|nr:vacuolar protein-sorting-associated protein 36 [Microsporum canis CBS 113480]EEQ29737.1 vacuolar protein-sorting-associated protein 36 [Microsporum canis CBS 113480]